MDDRITTQHDAARIVAEALIGMDYKRVLVSGHSYIIPAPTVHRIASAVFWLTEVPQGDTLHDMFLGLANAESLARALSCLIAGDVSLSEELAEGTLDELVDALDAAFSLVDTQSFIKLSVLLKSARILIAKPNI